MKRILIVLFLGISASLIGQEIQQDVIAAAGDFKESENLSISWTLGEIAVETLDNGTHIVTQGFQQGDLKISTLMENASLDFSLKAFPNPVMNKLSVEFDAESLPFQLVDFAGKIIMNGTLYNGLDIIDFTSLPPGTYFLVVNKHQTHKIIKN